MKKNNFKILKNLSLLFIAAYLLTSSGSFALNKPLSVAVFQFQAKDPAIKNLGSKISDLVMVNIAANPDIELVERDILNTILKEQGLGLTGIVDKNQAVKIGKLAGAKIFITGRTFTIDGELTVVAKVIGIETGVVFTEVAQGPLTGKFSNIVDELSADINKTISTKGTKLVAEEGKKEDVLSQITSQLKGKVLPKVSVFIEERHIGATVIDPEAETEMIYYLRKCGFTVVDDKSNRLNDWAVAYLKGNEEKVNPGVDIDIMIIGEAFSEYGTRKGDLISCKGRVEVKAIDCKNGKILAISRHTSTAIDLSEQIAGKNALQRASVNILGKFVHELVTSWNANNKEL